MTATGRTWFWIFGHKDGQAFRAGPYPTRERASSEGIRFCGADFEVFELPTRTTQEAGRMIKHVLATRSGMSAGFQRHGLHEGQQDRDTEQEERW